MSADVLLGAFIGFSLIAITFLAGMGAVLVW